jgi:type II secretory pathway pseudopilin PulG
VTLPELALVLALTGLLAAVAWPAALRARDRAAVRAASRVVAAAFDAARARALLHGTTATVRLLPDSGAVRLEAPGWSRRLSIGAPFGVTLHATRTVLAYGPNGLAYGAANLRAIVARPRAADTLWVSRLGRVR